MSTGSTSRTALVTGGAGFIGSHVAERLLRDGWDVVVVDDFDDYYTPALKLQNLRALETHPAFRLEVVDLSSAEATRALGDRVNVDCVVHLAAVAGVRLSVIDPARYARGNVLATQNVLDHLCRPGRRPLVFASSSSVYGNDTEAPFSEDAPCVTPASPYAATKRAAELLCHVESALHGTPITALRLFTVYGPRQRPDLAIRKFATSILRNEEVTVFGDGSMARDFTHVSDVVEAVVRAIDRRAPGYRTINIGNSHPVSVGRLVELLEAALSVRARVRRVQRPSGEMDVTFADCRRAFDLLGWSATVPIEAGLADFAAWLSAEERAGRNLR